MPRVLGNLIQVVSKCHHGPIIKEKSYDTFEGATPFMHHLLDLFEKSYYD